MNWRSAYETYWLARIVALFFFMAATAEAASTASPRQRRWVLDVLREAEFVGIDIVAGEGLTNIGHFEQDQGCEPKDAMRLAISLRTIAFALGYLVQFYEKGRQADTAWADDLAPKACAWLIVAIVPTKKVRKVPLIDTS